MSYNIFESGVLKPVTGGKSTSFRTLTQAEYDALPEATKLSPDIIFAISDDTTSITADSVELDTISGIESDNVQDAINELTQNITSISQNMVAKYISSELTYDASNFDSFHAYIIGNIVCINFRTTSAFPTSRNSQILKIPSKYLPKGSKDYHFNGTSWYGGKSCDLRISTSDGSVVLVGESNTSVFGYLVSNIVYTI